jgi:hypothetical protein
MEIWEALIAWNAPTVDRGRIDPANFLPRIKVVPLPEPFPSEWATRVSTALADLASAAECDAAAICKLLLLFRRLAHHVFAPLENPARACKD